MQGREQRRDSNNCWPAEGSDFRRRASSVFLMLHRNSRCDAGDANDAAYCGRVSSAGVRRLVRKRQRCGIICRR